MKKLDPNTQIAIIGLDIPHSLASIEKAKAILGYDPKYSVKNGLEEACSWYFASEKNI